MRRLPIAGSIKRFLGSREGYDAADARGSVLTCQTPAEGSNWARCLGEGHRTKPMSNEGATSTYHVHPPIGYCWWGIRAPGCDDHYPIGNTPDDSRPVPSRIDPVRTPSSPIGPPLSVSPHLFLRLRVPDTYPGRCYSMSYCGESLMCEEGGEKGLKASGRLCFDSWNM